MQETSVNAGGYIPEDRILHNHFHNFLLPAVIQISAEIMENHSCYTVIITITLNSSIINWKPEMVQLSRQSADLCIIEDISGCRLFP
jgi:hypothetical protein